MMTFVTKSKNNAELLPVDPLVDGSVLEQEGHGFAVVGTTAGLGEL